MSLRDDEELTPTGRRKIQPHSGRPSSLTRERHEALCEAFREGMYVEPAAWLAGVSPRSVAGWLARGRAEPDSIFGDFYLDAQRAWAEAERDSLRVMRRLRQDRDSADWRAHAEFLSRRFRERWAPLKQVEHKGSLQVKRVVLEDGQAGEEES